MMMPRQFARKPSRANGIEGAFTVKLTIGIKALNEEKHIEASLRSAMEAARLWDGEVILADSGSTDRTLEIARQFPVKIVQLANPLERSCGAGAQLAFQHVNSEYFYLLDGDMVLQPEFISAGLEFLESEPRLAGVGGIVLEMNIDAPDFQIRAAAWQEQGKSTRELDRLDCGGLYRVSAIRDVGYFADRNLHAFEEFELGARLIAKGWKLARIGKTAVEHFGHQTGGYTLLWRRFKSGYSGANGEVLRAAIGRPQLRFVLGHLAHIRIATLVIVWWLCALACIVTPIGVSARISGLSLLLLTPAVLLSIRRKSVRLGMYSLISWNVSALGLIIGFFRKRVPPEKSLASIAISSEPAGTVLSATSDRGR
jgi:GT2 family glycosyltransferase